MDGIRERENQLLLMKKQQAAMEAMSGQYEDQLKEMTKRIHAIEAEKRQLKQQMEILLHKQHTASPASNLDSVKKQHAELEGKLKQKDEEIQRINIQKRDLEYSLRDLQNHGRRIVKLSAEIQEMKIQRETLQRSKEQNERELKAKIEDKTKEILVLQRQTRQQTRQISELRHDNQKIDSMLRAQMERAEQMKRKVKELQLSADVQRREHERYSKEDQKRVQWLEKQLSLQGRKDATIRQLQSKLDQKEQAMNRLKAMMKTREEAHLRNTRKRIQTRTVTPMIPIESESGDAEEQEELDEAIAQVQEVLEVNTYSVNELEQALQQSQFDEEEVLTHLRNLSVKEARDMLCVLYKRLADYMREMKELQKLLGDKDVAMSELQRSLADTQRKLTTQRNRMNRIITQLKEEYEGKLIEVQKHERIEADSGDANAKLLQSFSKLKMRYLETTRDYSDMRASRDRYRDLYVSLKASLKGIDESDERSVTGSVMEGVTQSGSRVNKDNFDKLVKCLRVNKHLESDTMSINSSSKS